MSAERTQKEIRLFVSSTFDDQGAERTEFQKNVFPRLKSFCASFGWGFQVVDLRWGIRDESTDDHRTVEICMGEIDRCQKTSPGCYFALLLGNRYGWRPPAAKILATDYTEMIRVHQGTETEAKLQEWYRLDENVIPAYYKLTPLNDENRSRFWKTDMVLLTTAIHQAAGQLRDEGVFDLERYRLYTVAVTEQEVVNGLFNYPGADGHSLAFLRDIEGYKHSDPNGFRYANCRRQPDGSFELDQESWDLQVALKEHVSSTLPAEHVYNYKASWTGEGMSTDHVLQLAHDLETNLKHLIRKEIREFDVPHDLEKEEELQRAVFDSRVSKYVGRGENLQQLLNFCLGAFGEDADATEPAARKLVVTSESEMGDGKSSLLCALVKILRAKASEHFPDTKPHVIARRVGISALSSDFTTLVSNIAQQLEVEIGQRKGARPDLEELARTYKDKVTSLPQVKERLEAIFKDHISRAAPLVIVLIGVDQLSHFTLNWLPELPPHVRVLFTTNGTEKFNSCFAPESTVRLQSLSVEEGSQILDILLSAKQRKLAPAQRQVILDKFAKVPSPLFLKYLVDLSSSWISSTVVDPEKVPNDIFGSLEADFSRIIKYHGAMLTQHALAYILLSKEGLSEEELITILSHDEEVLTDVLQYHKPDPRKLPGIVWSRLYMDLLPYLREKNLYQTPLLTFNHPAIVSFVRKTYLPKEQEPKFYDISSQYFLEQPIMVAKPIPAGAEELEETAQKLLDEQKAENMKEVAAAAAQNGDDAAAPAAEEPAPAPEAAPETTSEEEAAPPKPKIAPEMAVNMRRPTEIVHHLIGARRFNEVQQVLTDMKYIETRIRTFGYSSYVDDLRAALAGGKEAMVPLDDIHELILLLQPDPLPFAPAPVFVPPKRWGFIRSQPWKAVPPSPMDNMRQRGTRALYFKVGHGWFTFNTKFQSFLFPPIPHLWSEKPSAARYMDPPMTPAAPGPAMGAQRPGMPGARPGMPGAAPGAANPAMMNPASKPFEPTLPPLYESIKRIRLMQGLLYELYRS